MEGFEFWEESWKNKFEQSRLFIFIVCGGLLLNNVLLGSVRNEYETVDDILKLSFIGSLQRYLGNFELMAGGTLLYEATDENGISCQVYDSGYIYCFKEPFVLKLIVNMEPISKKDADVKVLYQEYLIELGKTVQY